MPEVTIPGPAGRLEGRYSPSEDPNAPIALILHPHPCYGGTMNNKAVYTLFHCFVGLGFVCLRFNFRGIGRSEGEYSKGEGELADAAAALDWLQNQNPNTNQCWIGGASFGAWIAMQILMRRPELKAFISIAPPVNLYDFSFLAPCPTSGLIIQGSEDSIVPTESQQALVAKLHQQMGIKIDYHEIEGADHFFNNKLLEIHRVATEYISDNVKKIQKSPVSFKESNDDTEDEISDEDDDDKDFLL